MNIENKSKNYGAIDKIIAQLSKRDWLAQVKKNGKRKIRYGQFQYSLGIDTLEAIEIKNNYRNEKITEEEYKTWCLKWNIAHIESE